MKAENWETLEIFDGSINGKHIKFINSPLQMPKGVDNIIRTNWNKQLEEKQQALISSGIKMEIKPYHLDSSKDPLNALYEGEKPKMWPGPVVSLKEIHRRASGIELFVGQTYFPFIAGLKDGEVSKLYESQGITKPRPALAICTYAFTLDDQLTLTVRGPKTNMYPGRFYGQGGNPLFTDTDIISHQKDEMRDEILIQEDDYYRDSECLDFVFGGVVVDREQLPGKPDLIGWVPVELESGEIQERVKKRPLTERPNDAISVVFVPTAEGELFDYLTKRTNPIQYCPPARGGLIIYGRSYFGEDWAENLLERLE